MPNTVTRFLSQTTPITRYLLVCVAAVGGFLGGFNTWRLADPATFGIWHDDTLLVASAKSLSEGEGYELPSWPGGLPQTKYPPLYSSFVAGIWLAQSDLAGNLTRAYWVNVMFGAAFVGGCWTLLSGLGVSFAKRLCITSAIAAHPTVAMLSASLLTDMLFAAIVVWCAVMADRAIAATAARRSSLWAMASLLAALAILTRTLGLALLLGMGLQAWKARLPWRSWAMLLLPVGAAAGWMSWTAATTPDFSTEPLQGYVQTAVFYTSYLRFWSISVPDLTVLLQMLSSNLLHYLREPAALCLQIPLLKSGPAYSLISVAISIVILIGVFRRTTSGAGSMLHLAFIPYSAAVLLWNYPLMWRFLLPFLPMFLLAMIEQFERLMTIVLAAAFSRSPFSRVLGWSYLVAITLLTAASLSAYLWYAPAGWLNIKSSRADLAGSKHEMYNWVRHNTSPQARFVAYEDALLYLQTDRKAMRPIALTTEGLFRSDNAAVEKQLDLLTDTATRLKGDFWVISVDDFGVEPPRYIDLLRNRTLALFKDQEPLFRSRNDRVRIYAWGP